MKDPLIYGMMAEFDNVNDAIIAARRTYAAGYRKLDAYSPFPVEELAKYAGQWVAWSPDGTRVAASASSPEMLDDLQPGVFRLPRASVGDAAGR